MTANMQSLESPPAPRDRQHERRWTVVSLGSLAFALGLGVLAVVNLPKAPPAVAGPADHRPLPATVRAEVMEILDRYLLDARFEETLDGPVREFRIKGRTRAPLAQEFNAAFKPVVAGRLMPLLRPYGEIISFDIASLDLPPARLRPLPSKD
jgi:hypothetical protein